MAARGTGGSPSLNCVCISTKRRPRYAGPSVLKQEILTNVLDMSIYELEYYCNFQTLLISRAGALIRESYYKSLIDMYTYEYIFNK